MLLIVQKSISLITINNNITYNNMKGFKKYLKTIYYPELPPS